MIWYDTVWYCMVWYLRMFIEHSKELVVERKIVRQEDRRQGLDNLKPVSLNPIPTNSMSFQ